MNLPEIASRETWLAARTALLAQEKELTRRRDKLNADRRRLPMVAVEKDYVFTGPDGDVTLADLFGEHRQLIIQHVMYDPSWEEACPGCTGSLDELNGGVLAHLAHRNTAFAAVSRAPYPTLAAYRARHGWDYLPWYSSYGTSFNYDFHVSLDESVAPVSYNYKTAEELQAAGMTWVTGEQPGMSCFLRTPDGIFHTYSTFARGTDQLGGVYSFLDLTALGRQEEWEEPKGRASFASLPFFTDEAKLEQSCDC
jgi:predicted dithiol-disulfide oxidoreductase (DUF899 family)